eukprot:3242608-Lingulodinium_polyedra.AAC.1
MECVAHRAPIAARRCQRTLKPPLVRVARSCPDARLCLRRAATENAPKPQHGVRVVDGHPLLEPAL